MLRVSLQQVLVDSATAELRRVSDSVTIALLERSTQAADLTASWVGVSVGLLGVLFAVLAIGTAYTLYRQSKDFEERAAAQVASYREIVVKVAEEARLMAATAVEGIKSEAAEVTKKLDALGSEQKAERAELEERKQDLAERLKQLRDRDVPLIGPPEPDSGWALNAWSARSAHDALLRARRIINERAHDKLRTCTECGWKQTYRDEGLVVRSGLLQCPKCHEMLP